jgi:hypothetical protein
MKRLEEAKKIEDRIVNEIEQQEAWEEKLKRRGITSEGGQND